MEIAQKIKLPHWAMTPEAKTVMDALCVGGEGAYALFVGGCVRNTLLNVEVEDVDIATRHSPQEVTKRLEAGGVKVIPTGIDHGTVTAVVSGTPFEITTLRKDVETDGRRAVVAYTDDWKQDAQRRDFTMNTLLMDVNGNVFDPIGRGIDDLNKGQFIFVGTPSERIAEDYLRILRLFRFHAIYGVGDIDAEALSACRDAADKITTLSKERISQEFFKLMSAGDPTAILEIIFENNVLRELLFPEYKREIFSKLCAVQDKFNFAFLPSRLFILAGLSCDNIRKMQKLLLFPKLFLKDINAVEKVLSLGVLDGNHIVETAVYKFGRTATTQALLVQAAQGHIDTKFLAKPLEHAIRWEIPTFPISGNDLIKAGIVAGPELGARLDALEEVWIDSGFEIVPDI